MIEKLNRDEEHPESGRNRCCLLHGALCKWANQMLMDPCCKKCPDFPEEAEWH